MSDLKASEPDIIKTSPVTDFSLTKQPTLLASAKTAVSTQKAEAASVPTAPSTLCSMWTQKLKDAEDLRTTMVSALNDTKRMCRDSPSPQCASLIASYEVALRNQDNLVLRARKQKESYCKPGGVTGAGVSDILKNLLNKIMSVIRALREKADAAAIALWGKELASQALDALAWVECDGKDGFKINFPFINQAEALAVCNLRGCVFKHEASHIRDNMNTYPDRCKGEPAGTKDLWDKQKDFLAKSECRAYLIVTIPCLATGMSTVSEPCKAQLKKAVNSYKKLAYRDYRCQNHGYPPYSVPYPGY
ncbi:MAG: hypothetical protein HY796_00120 [Elusimicrobia bacterium]|nr:hypothetical protein [Elusimicrobiota bacterium]